MGHKIGSEVISQHLVLPLISVNHLAFTSADPVGEITESELEKVCRNRVLHFPANFQEFTLPIGNR